MKRQNAEKLKADFEQEVTEITEVTEVKACKGQDYLIFSVNDEHEPREAAGSGSRTQSNRNG